MSNVQAFFVLLTVSLFAVIAVIFVGKVEQQQVPLLLNEYRLVRVQSPKHLECYILGAPKGQYIPEALTCVSARPSYSPPKEDHP